jgi:hypothetical protein
MQLLGAREFIKMPPGTFYIEYWMKTIEECFQIIDKFKENSKSFLNFNAERLHVFGDNQGSMSFSGNKDDDYISYYDANVVGDACPSTTLYLIIEENELPNKMILNDENDNVIDVSKDYIINIKNMFVNEIFEKYDDKWPFTELDKLSVKGNNIVNIKIISE